MIRANRLAQARRVALVILTAFIGYICIRNSYATLRDRDAAVWALSLMWCVLAASSWAITVSLLRSRSHKTGDATAVDATTAVDETSSSAAADPTTE